MTSIAQSIDQTIKKIVTKKLFWLVFCGLGFLFPIYRTFNRELPPQLPKFHLLPEYNLTDENNHKFGTQDLRGKAYIANFIFTSCPSTCPGQTEAMKKIQKRVRGLGNSIYLISYTVDNEHDTPQVLFEYARKNKANPYVWKFLTGSTDDLKKLLIEGFKVPVGSPELKTFKIPQNGAASNQEISLYDIAHTEKFVLVDQDGYIRGYYSKDESNINKMMIDLGLLVNRRVFEKTKS